MNYKVNENKWEELIYLINNFYVPVKYTYGKGVYPDRVTFMRSKNAEQLFEPSKDVEFFILNARSNENSNLAIRHSRELVEDKITNSYFMNDALNYNNKQLHNYTKLFDYIQDKLVNSKTTNFESLNDFIIKAYKSLDAKDALKIAQFREFALKFCVQEQYISDEYASREINKLPNSLMKLSIDFEK